MRSPHQHDVLPHDSIPTIRDDQDRPLIARHRLDPTKHLLRTRTRENVPRHTSTQQSFPDKPNGPRLMAGSTTAYEGDLGRVMVCAIDDFEGRDEREVRVGGDEASEGSVDEDSVVVEDVSVGHDGQS